jgi:xylose isomerase
MKAALGDLGLQCVSVIPDLFGDKVYWKGSYSSSEAKVRRKAIDDTRQMCDIAHQLGCATLNLWPGQDGYDYLLCADYEAQRRWMCRRLRSWPAITLACVSPWSISPRAASTLCWRMADTLLLAQETGCANVGSPSTPGTHLRAGRWWARRLCWPGGAATGSSHALQR